MYKTISVFPKITNSMNLEVHKVILLIKFLLRIKTLHFLI